MKTFLCARNILIGGTAAIVVASMPAAAHHGWGGNERKTSDLTGTVVEGVKLSGPHATMKIEADGEVWDITLAPSGRMRRSGLDEGMIPIGATVTIRGNRNSTTEHREMKTVSVRWEDNLYEIYPDRL